MRKAREKLSRLETVLMIIVMAKLRGNGKKIFRLDSRLSSCIINSETSVGFLEIKRRCTNVQAAFILSKATRHNFYSRKN
jgi:hypothetical protein